MSEPNESVDRYGGTGPDPLTMCDGQCEGFGRYPAKFDDLQAALSAGPNQQNVREAVRWATAHTAPDAHPDGVCDGWHFVLCPTCLGTGEMRPQVAA